MKFHECASKYIKLCLDTELRYNHYLISVESWAMLCAIGERGIVDIKFFFDTKMYIM